MPSALNPNVWLYAMVELFLILMVGALSPSSEKNLPQQIERQFDLVRMQQGQPAGSLSQGVKDTVTVALRADINLGRTRFSFERIQRDSLGKVKTLVAQIDVKESDLRDRLVGSIQPGFDGVIYLAVDERLPTQNFLSMWEFLASACSTSEKVKCTLVLRAKKAAKENAP
jgi:hypothetical protein